MVTQYRCKKENRRAIVRRVLCAENNGKFVRNGIDYIEVDENCQSSLKLHLIHNISEVISGKGLSRENIVIEGGVRVAGIQAVDVQPSGDQGNVVTITVNTPGDFSTYTLRLVKSRSDIDLPPDDFDPQLSEIEFSFKVNCPSEFDCKPRTLCPPEHLPEPQIDYLVKDYNSFRQLMLDRVSLLLPGWKERNAADTGVALIELLAYVGDHLSYRQDAISTEAYLGTARKRISVRRHAKLVDYNMHDGCNARAWVQVKTTSDSVLLSKGARFFTNVPGLPRCVGEGTAEYQEAVDSGAAFFETMEDITLFNAHNEISFHAWGDEQCCLPKGATRATLKGKLDRLDEGDVLVFKEIASPVTGKAEDADPRHRHAVRLSKKPRCGAVDPFCADRDSTSVFVTLDVTEIEWAVEDALPFPLCLSAITDAEHGAKRIDSVSIVLGNIVLTDHGRSVIDRHYKDSRDKECRPLKESPVTQAARYEPDWIKSAAEVFEWEMEDALPAISLKDGDGRLWNPKHDLMSSNPFAAEFVAEVDEDGIVNLRFGDGVYGMKPEEDVMFDACYRVGSGAAGNIGYDTLCHIVRKGSDKWDRDAIAEVVNPLPARGGADPESIEHARQRAPWAFRTQKRAVTSEDYAEVAERHRQVQRAVATVRWTGSWRTVYLNIDRIGGLPVNEEFKKELTLHMEKYRMAGHDLEIEGPRYVPLEIDIDVCVEPDHFCSDIKEVLLDILGRGIMTDGRLGLFHPDNFTFGQAIYSNSIYVAAQAPGVKWLEVTKFQRLGIDSDVALSEGVLRVGRLEVICLDNDPDFQERGILRLCMSGGRERWMKKL